jgi:NADPH:quinone reductase-like Zn-dependent oxidoreductase
MMFVTAYSALVEDAAIGVGDFVVISAASSSVGLAAIQIANYAGATPIALTRTSAKADQLREVGATHVVATQETDLVQEITRITDGKGARIAFDPIGGPDFPKLLAALAFKGTAYLYGALAEGITPLPVLDMIAKMPVIKGHNIWITSGDPDRLATAVAYIRQGFAEGKLKAVIDRVFSFDDIVAAHHYLETNGQFGKIVVTL